jgi:hypothetical protein
MRESTRESARHFAGRVIIGWVTAMLDKHVSETIALSGNALIHGVDVLSSPSTHRPPQVPRPGRTMLLCYLTTKMGDQLDTISSLQQVLSRHRSIPCLHRWHRPSAIPFSRTSCAWDSGLECSLTRTKNPFRQSGKRSFQHRHRRVIQRRPRFMRSLNPMLPLPTRTRHNVEMLPRR